MQITPVAAAASALPPLTQLRNVHLTSRVEGPQPWVTYLDTVFVDTDPANADAPYGGTRSRSQWVNGESTGIRLTAFLRRPDERAAAQAVVDAITASGLLAADLPVLDWKNPEVGRTRLYLDRRSRFLEYDTANPPAVVQPILDAIAAYERIAR